MKPTCCAGDILYVRETFCLCCLSKNFRKGHSNYCYKASVESPVYGCIDHFMGGEQMRDVSGCSWHPSIHMPKEAARIFLRVTGVRVERLQDINDDEALKEGCGIWGDVDWLRFPREDFSRAWNSTVKPADRAVYGWDANPWVWVIAFERCEKPEVIV